MGLATRPSATRPGVCLLPNICLTGIICFRLWPLVGPTPRQSQLTGRQMKTRAGRQGCPRPQGSAKNRERGPVRTVSGEDPPWAVPTHRTAPRRSLGLHQARTSAL